MALCVVLYFFNGPYSKVCSVVFTCSAAASAPAFLIESIKETQVPIIILMNPHSMRFIPSRVRTRSVTSSNYTPGRANSLLE